VPDRDTPVTRTAWHELVIALHYSFLVENLELNLSTMVDGAVLLPVEAKSVEAELSLYARNVLLLRLLVSKSSDLFIKFLKLLRQQYIIDYISFGHAQLCKCDHCLA